MAIPTTFAYCNSINIFKFEVLHCFSMSIHSVPHHGSFDTFSHSGKTKKRWDPTKTLEITNPDRNCLTCVGYVPSRGRRCLNPINQANRASAFRLLNNLENIDPSTTNIKPQLCRLAGLTLCLKDHQNQVTAVVDEWMSVLPVRNSFKIEATGNSDDELGHLSRNELERMLKEMKEILECNRKLLECNRKQQENKDRQKRERELEKERQEKERQEKERQEKERQEKEQEEKERRERRRQEKEREERERQERERKQREEEEKQREKEERKKREREAREKEEQEKKEKERRESEERNERVRQRAQRAKEERERKEREKAETERKEWDEIWLLYSKRWDGMKICTTKATPETLRDIIPWPVKSGRWGDVTDTAVEEFFQKALPATTDASKKSAFMKMECRKWHPDKAPKTCGGKEDEALYELFNIVARVVIKIYAEAKSQRNK